jgi:hypothetical protein
MFWAPMIWMWMSPMPMFWTNVSNANVFDCGMQIVSDGMSWMPMSWMQRDWTQERLFAIEYCMLLNYFYSECVHEIMWCFRSTQYCVVRVHCSWSVASDPIVLHVWLPPCDVK